MYSTPLAVCTVEATRTFAVNGVRPLHLLRLTAVRLVLLEECDHVFHLLRVFEAWECHLRALHQGLRVWQIGLKRCFVPGQVRVLVRVGIIEVGIGACLAADDAVQRRPDGIFGVWSDLMTRATDGECFLTRRGILRIRGAANEPNERNCKQCDMNHETSLVL